MSPTTKKIIFFAAGLLAAVWFFVGYPSQDPRTLIDTSEVDEEIIEQKAEEKLESLGYNSSNFRIRTRLYSNQQLLENLQRTIGRDEMISQFQQNEFPNLKLYFWDIYFIQETAATESTTDEDEVSAPDQDNQDNVRMRFDLAGNFIEFVDSGNLPVATVNRSALASAFGAASDSASKVLSSHSDTSITNHLLVDVQQNWSQFNLPDIERVIKLKSALKAGRSFRLSTRDVFRMASSYLQQTGWNVTELAQDTVYLGRTEGSNTVSANFTSQKPQFDQELSLEVQLTTTGGLVGINSSYNADVNANGGELWSSLRQALLFLFFLGGVVLFFFRIRARAIDTQPALVVSVITGLAVSLLVLLNMLHSNNFLINTQEWSQSIQLLMRTGFAGAGASVAFFVFFALGDSVTRQYWPEKLNMYDYIRQGMIFNKPVGFMLVRSVTLAFILAGVWTLVLWLFPQISFHIHYEIFLSQQAMWPPLFLGLSNGVFSLALVIGIFLVLGGQAMAQTKNKIAASSLMILACAIMVPYSGYLEANGFQAIAGLILGSAMLGIYLQWNFLTLLLSHFLFLILATTTTGWIISGSMDMYLFVGAMVLIALLLVCGFVSIGRGKDEKILSRYVPQYVEDLAQEERIKQELQIAREVQQSFLPVDTPKFDTLELAAICKPAYETGGDYYDFITLDDHRVAVAIGDVSGKGIQAAFFMTFVKGVLHSLCREFDSPANILKKTNRLFCENVPRGTFVSLVYGIIDLEKKVFQFARAGHNPILRLRPNDGSVEELQPQGIGIGLTANDIFDENIEEVELDLSADEVLVLYTDGIVEALNKNHKFYGSKRLNKLLVNNRQRSASGILEEISFDVRSFIAEAKQHDDMTMLVMKLKK